MKQFIVAIGCAAAILVTANVALGQGRSGGPKAKSTAGASMRGGGSAVHGGGASAHGGAKTHGGGSRTVKAGGKAHGPTVKSGHAATHTKAATAKKSKLKSTDSTTAARTKKDAATTPSTIGTLTPVQQKLLRNTNLAAKLQSRLPAGTDLMLAAAGFRNLGQFVAAVNVSNNLGIAFPTLKTAMVDNGMSLGQAIQAQRPSVDGTVEANRAQRDAAALIGSTDTAPTETSISSTKKTSRKVKPAKSDSQ
jgi:hypothetical protein